MAERRCVDLKPLAELAPAIGTYVAELDDLLSRLKHRFGKLTPEELDWSPAAEMNSAGTLLLHMATVEVSWIHEDVLGGEFPRDLPEQRRHRDEMLDGGLPPFKGQPIEFYLEQLDSARARTKKELAAFSDADLDGMHAGEGDYEFSLRWILYHLVEHAAYHEGQIGYLLHLRKVGFVGLSS